MTNAPYDTNKITSLIPAKNGVNHNGSKEIVAEYAFVAPNPKYKAGDPYYGDKPYIKALTIRVYMGRSASASTVYATVWAHSRDGETYLSGTGAAGGYGYDKESAAINSAMCDAGVTFKRSFGGCGTGAQEVAIKALAKRLGWKRGMIM